MFFGYICYGFGDLEGVIENYLKCLMIEEEIGVKYGKGIVYCCFGVMYKWLVDLKLVKEYFK